MPLWDRACIGSGWRAVGEGGGRGGRGERRGGRTSEVFGDLAVCFVEHHDRDGVHHHWNLALRYYIVYCCCNYFIIIIIIIIRIGHHIGNIKKVILKAILKALLQCNSRPRRSFRWGQMVRLV